MLTTRQLAGTIGEEYRRIHLVEGTKIAPLAAATAALLAEWPKFQKLTRERQQAHVAKTYEKNAMKYDAREAGKRGEKYDVKAAKKRLAEAKSIRNELDLRWEEACGRIEQMIADYRALLVEHAPRLREEALKDAEEGVRTLTTARTMADKSQATLDASIGVLGGLISLTLGEPFTPRSLKAGGRMTGAPTPHIGIAVEGLSTAVGLASELLEQQRTNAAAADKALAQSQVVEGTEDSDDEDGWEDDDDDD